MNNDYVTEKEWELFSTYHYRVRGFQVLDSKRIEVNEFLAWRALRQKVERALHAVSSEPSSPAPDH